MFDEAKLKAELLDLHERRQVLDTKIREVENRLRFSRDPGAVEVARQDERTRITEMDRLMTRLRAVEAKLLIARGETPGSGPV